MRTMVSFCAEYDDKAVMCAVHTRVSPKFDEWREYLGQVRELMVARPGLVGAVGLAVTDGGAPTFPQRSALVNVTGDVTPAGAVISDNKIVRVAVTALNVFGFKLRVFAPERFSEACDFLGIVAAARPRLVEDIQRAAQALERCTTSAALKL